MTDQDLKTLRESINYDVFGWKRSRELEHPNRAGWRRPDGEFILDRDAPDWPQDPAAAMLVLEKCGKRRINGTSFVCCAFSGPGVSTLSECGHWNVGRIKDGHWDGSLGAAETLPLAICLFAKQLFKP